MIMEIYTIHYLMISYIIIFQIILSLHQRRGLLNNLMANTSQSSIHPDFFFPRTYDFGEAKQIDEFVQDFYRTALMSSLKKHVEYFWKNNRESLEFIDLEMQSVDPGINCKQIKKSIERRYRNVTFIDMMTREPSCKEFDRIEEQEEENEDDEVEETKEDDIDEEEDININDECYYERQPPVLNKHNDSFQLNTPSVVVNVVLLRKIMTFIEKMIQNDTNDCEEGEYYILNGKKKKVKKNLSLKINIETNKLHRILINYSTIKFPHEYDKTKKNWKTPSLLLQYQALKLHQELFKVYPQYHIDGKENIWISKPSYNARGVGIFIINSLKDVISVGRKAQAHRIMQKYIERPFLIKIDVSQNNSGSPAKRYETRKFDIRQWVL